MSELVFFPCDRFSHRHAPDQTPSEQGRGAGGVRKLDFLSEASEADFVTPLKPDPSDPTGPPAGLASQAEVRVICV